MLLNLLVGKPVKRSYAFEPNVTFIVSLYNEENYVVDCIESIFNSDYPKEKITVLAGSDGSTDGTTEKLKILSEKYPQKLQFFDFPRSGKNKILNNLIPLAKDEIILFTDADARLRKDSLKELVANFADENVGSVTAAINILAESSGKNSGKGGEMIYQDFESIIRTYESKIYTTVNNLGTLYGIRKELLKSLPNDFVCDDMYILLNCVNEGKRAIFTHSSVVDEVRVKSLSGEMQRRIRLVGGGISTLLEFKELLFFKKGLASFFVWNHKVFRWFTPLLMLFFLVSLFILSPNSLIWLILFYSQLILYISSIIGWLAEKAKIKLSILKIPLFFVSMNIGFLLGFFRFLSKGNNAVWERVDTNL